MKNKNKTNYWNSNVAQYSAVIVGIYQWPSDGPQTFAWFALPFEYLFILMCYYRCLKWCWLVVVMWSLGFIQPPAVLSPPDKVTLRRFFVGCKDALWLKVLLQFYGLFSAALPSKKEIGGKWSRSLWCGVPPRTCSLKSLQQLWPTPFSN